MNFEFSTMTELQFQQARLNMLMEKTENKFAIVFEGRDCAGKSSSIREIAHYLPIKFLRINVSKKPTAIEMKKWFRYWRKNINGNSNKITLYDRSWYSRALIQAVNGWCTGKQYRAFMKGVVKFEKEREPVVIIKFWLAISKTEQELRINRREVSPLKYWKLSENDKKAISKYDQMTLKKEAMISIDSSWISIPYDNRKQGILQLITTLNDEIENNHMIKRKT